MVTIDCGQFRFHLQEVPGFVREPLHLMYGDQWSEAASGPTDFRISLRCDSLLRRFVRRQLTFYCDQHAPFRPVPRSQAFPVLEWGMNWCMAAHDYTRLLIHAAVLVRNGQAVIFPAVPGAGKSTLAAYLSFHGWDLYSDEMAVVDIASGTVSPLFRPVCLKNDSIRLIRQDFSDAVLTGIARDTRKGDIAHLKAVSWQRFKTFGDAKVVAVVFPQYKAEAGFRVQSLSQLQAFRQICSHAFNYNILGRPGFAGISRLVEGARHYSILYSELFRVRYFLGQELAA